MIYLNHAATSFPKPESVYLKMDRFYRENGVTPGRSGHRLALESAAEIERTRKKLADFVNAGKPENVIFTYNATDSLNMAVRGFLKPGDEVITTVMEHNSLSRPIRHLEKELKLKVKKLAPKNGIVDPDELSKVLSGKTGLVAMLHASNVTGIIQPIETIGKMVKEKSNAAFLLDASQTAGLLSIDMKKMHVDMLAFPGHKSLYGPTGSGVLAVAEGIELKPFRTGGSGILSEEEFQPQEMPYRLESGTENLPGIAGLGAGIDFVLEKTLIELRRHDLLLKKILLEELKDIDGISIYTSEKLEDGIGIVNFNLKGLAPSETAAILEGEFDIAVRAGLQCAPGMHRLMGTFPDGAVRISFGYFNTEEEIMKTAGALKKIALG